MPKKLEVAQIAIPITAGVDDFSDPKQAKRMGTSQNVYVNRDGEIERRPGLDKHTTDQTVNVSATEAAYSRNTSSAVTRGHALGVYKDAPLLFAADAYIHDEDGTDINDGMSGAGAWLTAPRLSDDELAWTPIGEVAPYEFSHTQVPIGSNHYPAYDRAVSGNVECIVWQSKTNNAGSVVDNVMYLLRDLTTGKWIQSPLELHQMATNGQVRLHVEAVDKDAGDGHFIAFVQTIGQTALRVKFINGDTGVASTLVTRTTIANDGWGVCQLNPHAGHKCALLAYRKTGGGNELVLEAWSGDGPETSTVTTHTYAGAVQIDCNQISSGWVAVAVAETGLKTHLLVFNATTLPGTAADTDDFSQVLTSLSVVGAPTEELTYVEEDGHFSIVLCGVAAQSSSAATGPTTVPALYSETFSFDGSTTITSNVSMHIDWFKSLNARMFIMSPDPDNSAMKRVFRIAQVGSFQGNTEVGNYANNRLVLEELRVRWSANDHLHWHTVGEVLSQNANNLPAELAADGFVASLPSVRVVSNEAFIPIRKQRRFKGLDTKEEDPFIDYALAVVKMSLGRPFQFTESAGDLIVGGPYIKIVDGLCQEVGFSAMPEVIVRDNAGGTETFRYIFEWLDQNGKVYRSTPSDAITDGSDGQVYWCAAPHSIGKMTEYFLAGGGGVWVNWVNAPTKLSRSRGIWYKTATAANLYRNESDPDGDTFLFAGSEMEMSVTPGAAGANTDAELDDNELLYTTGGILPNSAPPSGNIVHAHNNRVFMVPFEAPTTVWYSKTRIDGIGLEFSNALQMTIADGGDITGLSSLDDYLVVFKEKAIFLVFGEGPNNAGIGDFSLPRRVETEVGCRDPNSVVAYTDGVMFKSNTGWYRLTRSLEVVPVGLEVSSYDAHVVHRTIVVPELRQIRVMHNPDDSAVILVFDYLRNKWDTIEYASAATGTLVDMANVDGTVHVLGEDGVVWQEDDTTNADDGGTAFTTKLVSPWVQNELTDVQRIWWVKFEGEWPASGNLTVKFYHDYSASAFQTATVDVSTINADGVFRLKPDRGICKAFRVELSGAIYRISRVSLEVGVRPGRIGRVTSPTVS